MCGRFAFYAPREAVQAIFGVEFSPPLEPRYNIAPTQLVGAVRHDADGAAEGVRLQWGLVPFWAKDAAIGNRMINARVETLASKPAFRAALARRRCVILASGFYEWRADQGGKTPCYISNDDEAPFAMAGLWERWEKGAEPLETCTIITREADARLRPIHHRMPVILPPDAAMRWIGGAQQPASDPLALLQAAGDVSLVFREVGRAVNNPRNDDPSLITARH